jgi:integrase
VLCAADTGEPLYEPLLYSLTEMRAANNAFNTLRQALRAIKLLQLVLSELKVDLSARLAGGQSLTLAEVEAVSRAASLAMAELSDEGELPPPPKVVRLESLRARGRAQPLEEVGTGTKAIRLHYIRHYLDWLTTSTLLRTDPHSQRFHALRAAGEVVSRAIGERMPRVGTRNTEGAREGLAPDELVRLMHAIVVDGAENPWKGTHNRVRNNLLVRWYLSCGVRRAELLNVRVTDINFQKCEVLIARRPDSPEDPRLEQPLVKTNDRMFPVDPTLAKDTHDYVLNHRRTIAGARRHPFLFVASGSGRPLSLSAVNLVFEQLRKVEGLPADLTPHVMRHTWNDAFSELSDKQGLSAETEQKVRSRVMGWSETSATAVKYTRRHVRRKSRDAMLAMQQKLANGGSDEA